MQGTTGTWEVGRGHKYNECSTGSGGRRYGIVFGRAVQDRNEGEKLGAKERCRSVKGWRMVGEIITRRVKGTDPEKSRTVGRGFKIRC